MNRNIAIILSANDAPLRHVLAGSAGAINAFEKEVESANTRMSAFGSIMKQVAMAGILAVGFALGYSIVQAVQFEKEMRNVNTVAHESEAGLKAMSAAVLEMSTELPQSADTLAKGLYDVASSGFYGADALKVLEVSAMAASAGLTETSVASKAIVGVLNAYGLTANDAADVSDVLFKTVELGVLTFEDLATQLGDVIGAASAAAVPIDEVGAAIAAMTLSGLSAAESTTSLNRLLKSLINPNKELSQALHNLGYESGAAALEQDGLHGVMEKIRLATGGQITELIKLFPEIRAARGAFALMANEGGNYERVFSQITDETKRAGSTQEAFNEQMKAVGNQWILFKNQINVAAIELGTHLLPAVAATLEGVQNFSTSFGNLMKDLASRARPALKTLGEAFSNIGDIIGTVSDVVSAVAVQLGNLFRAGGVAGLQVFANALKAVTGVAMENEGVLRVLTTLLGGVLVSKLAVAAGAFVAFKASLLLDRAAFAIYDAGGLIDQAIVRIGMLGGALNNLRAGNFTGAMAGITGAFSGLASVLLNPVFLGTVIFGGFTAFSIGAQNAQRQAKELRAELEDDINFKSTDDILRGLDDINAQLDKSAEKVESYRNLGGFFKFAAETLTPMKNGLQDASAEMDELNAATVAAHQAFLNLDAAQTQLQGAFGLTESQVTSLLTTLEFDPRTATGEWLPKLLDDTEALLNKANLATPAQLELADSLETVGGVAADASDRIDALKNAIDGLLGIAIDARAAEADLAEAIQGLGDSVAENGLTFDIWTEAGRNNEQALRDNITAMIDLANATANESGQVTDGVNVLKLYREQLLNNLTQMGMTREGAEALIATYGLTPENLQTLVSLQGADESQAKMDVFNKTLEKIADAKVNPKVNLDDVTFMQDVAGVGAMLIAIEDANPEAEVFLNDEHFRPDAAMIMAWINMYGEQSPEAMALLNILDPENKFPTLTALLNSWNSSSGTADANAQDNASPVIHTVNANLLALDGRSATVTINQITRAQTLLVGSKNVPLRWGGIVPAQMGLSWQAQVFGAPTILAGERPTGGEAFIPRIGNRPRSLGILDTAAKWYGMGIHPLNQRTGMGDVGINNNVSVTVGAGADANQVSRAVEKAMSKANEKMLRSLRQELVAR